MAKKKGPVNTLQNIVAFGIAMLCLFIYIKVKDPHSSVADAAHAPPAVTAPSGDYTVARGQAYAQQIFRNGPAQQHCLVLLWNRESGWNPKALESSYMGPGTPTYAYGIPQINPGSWGHPVSRSDWAGQIRWGKWYIDTDRYGSPCNAWKHEEDHGWY